MMTLVAFIVVLGPLILLHEFGHFIIAKLTGVRVEEFGLGWPPRLFKFWQSPSRLKVSSTVINTPSNFELPQELKVSQYVDVITGRKQEEGYTLQELRVLDPEKDDLTQRHEIVDQGVHIRGQLTELDPGTAYTLNWVPLGGFCRMTGEEDPSDPRSLAAQPKRVRIAVLVGGAVVNLIVAIVLFSIAFLSGVPEPGDTQVTISAIAPDSPAAEAGLEIGDAIFKADGTVLQDTFALVDYINAHAGQTIVLTIKRGETELEQPVWVRPERRSDGRVGVSIYDRPYNYTLRRSPLLEAVTKGVEQFWLSTKQMLKLPALLIRGQVSAQEVKPLGPLGISQLASDAIERSNEQNSLFTVLYYAAAISMALGITNLLPLPALDGGRILFVIIEALRGRRVDPAKEAIVHIIGIALLLGITLIITIQELINPVVAPF